MKTAGKLICLILFTIIIVSCQDIPTDFYDPGVSVSLAEIRKGVISDLEYTLRFDIPESRSQPVNGNAVIGFTANSTRNDILLDFREEINKIKGVELNGKKADYSFKNDHIILPKQSILKGQNTVSIIFEAGNQSLNRNEDFLYTLFVPDRAATAFPCFDQPDIKARFSLILDIDSSWTAIANNRLISETYNGDRKVLKFDSGKPISTYLFAFAAGRFSAIVKSVDGIEMQMLHRENREELLSMNTDEIFELHAKAIRWLEEYTGIAYPFDKFGFILIPSFQYSGMEHPGSIYYRAGSLLLEENPSINQKLSRAGLIAHETSHIWFGDLVTMEWFNDVWLKEVFAGYMSDKITNPSFPEVNHKLRFMLGRYPAAYSVDRTRGTNPVIQDLANMKEAGTLYGAIIYNKAPVVMQQLEQLMGEDSLRSGLRKYLFDFSFGNAKWDDLVGILDPKSDADIESWSEVWVKEAGRPTIETNIETLNNNTTYFVGETDPAGKGRHWPQSLQTLLLRASIPDTLVTTEPSGTIREYQVYGKTEGYIPGVNGITYGLIKMPRENIEYLIQNVALFDDPLIRGVIWLNSWENMLAGNIQPKQFLEAVIRQAPDESEPLLAAQLRDFITQVYWYQLDSIGRADYTGKLERILLDIVKKEPSISEKKGWFGTFVSISMTDRSLDFIYDLWKNSKSYDDIKFNESDHIEFACNLALKGYCNSGKILEEQASRIINTDRKEEFKFIMQALDSSSANRDKFFNSLLNVENREREPWVLKAISYLHHPINARASQKYIPSSLDLLKEIQETGDIFFPGQWISTTLRGHNNEEVYKIVSGFLDENSNYPKNLRLKILQASDHLYRNFGGSANN